MITYLKCENGFAEVGEWSSGCWVDVEQPTPEELETLMSRFGLPGDFLEDISDIDERPRVERNDGWICTILRIPIEYKKEGVPYVTVPVGVIVNGEYIITVCYYTNKLIPDFVEHSQKRGIDVPTAPDFILRLLNSSAYWYLAYLKDVKNMVADAESGLRESIRNEELLRLMNLQKSFVIFATSISGNNILLDRIKRLYGHELDKELFEDVSIELRQADSTVTIATQMLDRTLNTYASVISNNVNAIMKRLTSISLILMIPTLIASFYGMNVDVGISMDNHWAFAAIGSVGFALAVITCIWMRKIKWL
ncbi:MAG: magnesium transporter CorA family protein [Muribaculaceae bacterium]|nr:magnesium transporter CorA family protein [Muribaculaceae bacterium]